MASQQGAAHECKDEAMSLSQPVADLRTVLDMIDGGTLDASPAERAFIAGALAAVEATEN
jgi:hypothetical protein